MRIKLMMMMMIIIIIIMRRITRRVPAVWMTNRRRHLVKSTFRCFCAPLLLRFGQLWCKYKTCTCLLWQFWKSNPSIATLVRLLSSCKWFVSRAPVDIPGQERQEEEKEGRREAFRQCCNKMGAIANLQILSTAPFLFVVRTDYMDSPDFYCYFWAYAAYAAALGPFKKQAWPDL